MKSRFPLTFVLILTTLFSLLRFVHLQADFPSSAWEPSFALTDEGWYTRGAAEAVLHQAWHVDGDFNPAVDLPILSVLDFVPFRLFGVSVNTARAVNVLFAICSIWLLFFLVREFESNEFSAACALVLSTSSFWFDYSRVALLEFPMTALFLFGCFISLRRSNHYLNGILTGCILTCAVLTKWTAFSMVPAVWLLTFWKFGYSSSTFKKISTSALVIAIGILGYRELVLRSYETDHAYFEFINVTRRVHAGPLYMSLLRSLYHVHYLGIGLTLVALVGLIFSFLKNRSKLLQPLFLFAAVWFLLFIAALTYAHNQPPRYYQPLLVPVVLMFMYGLKTAWEYPRLRIGTVGIFGLIVAWGISVNAMSLLHPGYSVIGMQRDVARIMGPGNGEVLLGHFANSITLETHIPSINSTFAPGDLENRVRRFKPTHYIAVDGSEETVRVLLNRSFQLEEVARYVVEDSPPIRLFRVVPFEVKSAPSGQAEP